MDSAVRISVFIYSLGKDIFNFSSLCMPSILAALRGSVGQPYELCMMQSFSISLILNIEHCLLTSIHSHAYSHTGTEHLTGII